MSKIYVSDVDSRTDVGKVRAHNEDFMAYHEPRDAEKRARYGCLYVVADGMGGESAGEVASRYAVQKVLHAYYKVDAPSVGEKLRTAFAAANTDIHKYTTDAFKIGRMGTTLVAAVVKDDTLTVANTGDSRAYMIRAGEIRQITEDHSLVARLVAEGIITPEEAKHHPQRSLIFHSIGGKPDVVVDIFEEQLLLGDHVLLCTDGLTRHVTDEEIGQTITNFQPAEATLRLVELANRRGGRDNISVTLLTMAAATGEREVEER